MKEPPVFVTGVFHQCKVKMGIKPVVNPMEEIESLERKQKNKDGSMSYVSFFICSSCGERVSFSYKKVDKWP